MKTEKQEVDEKPLEIELLSTLTGEFFPDEKDYDDLEYFNPEEGETLDGEDLVQYEESIREYVHEENQLDAATGESMNLMDYFSGSDAIKCKVESAVVSIKNMDRVLYGCTTLKLRAALNEKELSK